ncbi:unnamed protein product [Cylicostephanus goldi]|uniref:NTR domain-containing protein n=1 Tax=Cylicostephanus goldi TaxID=71465 RepID=A0A3P7MCA8_CYLGO|nr:unnamed protein product [Cylicostephanus goldi]
MQVDQHDASIIVSLVKVTNSAIDESKDPLEQRQYTVKHTEVFKKPSGCNSLPEKIYTSTQSASCGVQLETGKEYLLTGSYDDDNLNIITCGQIASEDYPGIIMERGDISKNFLNEIRSYKC